MIVSVGSNARFLAAARRAARKLDDIQVTTSWEDLPRALARARAVIFLCPHPTEEETQKINAVHDRLPLLPLFLVTHAGSREFASTSAVQHSLTGVVWDDRLADLDVALAAALTRKPWERFYEAMLRRPSLPPKCREALELISVARDAPATFGGIARRVKTTPSTLRRQWLKHVSVTATPKDLQEWVRLLHWVDLSATTTLAKAAVALRVDPRTLDRIAMRRAEQTPKDCAENPGKTIAKFERWVRAAF